MGFISPVATDASGVAKDTGSMQSLGKDDFLQLMITKLQYQDPLEPMADEDFIAQLAQFSSLEQMNNISEGIETANQWSYLQMQSQNNVMASGFIGKEVSADYSTVYIDDSNQPVISYSTTQYANDLEFKILDSEGAVVTTLKQSDVATGTGSIKWDGKDSLGNRVAEGFYTVEATGTNPSGDDFTPKLSLVGVVEKVVYRDGSAYLMVNGTELALGDITSIGAAESADTGDSSGDDGGSGNDDVNEG